MTNRRYGGQETAPTPSIKFHHLIGLSGWYNLSFSTLSHVMRTVAIWVVRLLGTNIFALGKKYLSDQPLVGPSKLSHLVWIETHLLSSHRFGVFPNIQNPKTFNDFLVREMITGIELSRVRLSDKLMVRNFVLDISPQPCVVLPICMEPFPSNFDQSGKWVLKTNHDSGSVVINPSHDAVQSLRVRAKKAYGVPDGEWPYRFIDSKIFLEERLSHYGQGVPVDYKFHCSNGHVIVAQVLSGRGYDPKKVLVETNGSPIPVFLDQGFGYHQEFHRPKKWNAMLQVAKLLSRNFRYVRVDLYESSKYELPVFGELTFYPHAATYESPGNALIGKRLEKILSLEASIE